MTTVLIAGGADPYAITTYRCRFYTHLLLRATSARLDRALAAGCDPDSGPMLSLRAQSLISAANRRSIAGRFRRILDDALYGRRHADARAPLARRQIIREQSRIEELIELLQQSDPVDPQGIAQLLRLLADGAGPLYVPGCELDLASALDAAMDTLEAPPTIHDRVS